MWQVKEFHIESVQTWFNHHVKSGFLKHEKPIVLPNTPFEVEITPLVFADLKTIYTQEEERGGIIFCETNNHNGKFLLKSKYVVQIPNTFQPSPEKPDRTRKNTYRPDQILYENSLSKNFLLSTHSDILFPIHFHTHPIEKRKEVVHYFRTYEELNTSDGDRDVATRRFAEFNNVKLRYMNAIFTGSEDEHHILLYAPGVTPLKFFMIKFMRVIKKFDDLGELLSEFTKNPNGKELIQRGTKAVGGILTALCLNDIDFISQMFEDNEYFTTLNEKESTFIVIPKYLEKITDNA